jgi:hypothetical protein
MTNYRQTMAEAMEKVHLSEKEINKLRNGVKVLGNALPNRALAQQMADKANKEMGHNADVYQSPFNNRFYVRIKEDINEADDHEISMARGELEAISDKALKLSSILQGKTDKDNIEAWVQSKITKAKDYINSVADYMEYNPDMKQNEEVELEEGVTPAMIAMLKKEYEPFRGKTITAARAKQLMNILDKFKDDDLKKLSTQNIPFISSGSKSKLVVRNMKFKVTEINPFKEETDYLEETFELIEGKMSQIHAMMKDGKSAAEIAKVLKLDYKTVKDILGEKVEEAVDKKEKEKTPAVEPDVRSDGEKEVKKEDDSEKLKSELEKKDNEIAQLKVKAETEKAKNVQKQTQKMVNPETGEPLLQVGIAYKHLKDKMAKAKEKDVKEEVSKDGAYAIGMAQAKKKFNDEPPLDKKTITKGHEIAKSILKKESNEHPAKEIFEAIAVVKNKAEKTGMPYSILKQVYDRGMAAWRGGHRPGATQVQWALARVNSFVTKSSGTWGGADKDLAAKVKGSK